MNHWVVTAWRSLSPEESDLARRHVEPAGKGAGRERSCAAGLAHQEPVMRTSALRLESELLFHHEITGFAPEDAGYGGRSEGAREPVEGG